MAAYRSRVARPKKDDDEKMERAIFTLPPSTRHELDWLVGRHQILDGRGAVSKSEVVRDLIARAYTALQTAPGPRRRRREVKDYQN